MRFGAYPFAVPALAFFDTFVTNTDYRADAPESWAELWTGDFNRDGFDDLALVSDFNTVWVVDVFGERD